MFDIDAYTGLVEALAGVARRVAEGVIGAPHATEIRLLSACAHGKRSKDLEKAANEAKVLFCVFSPGQV